MTTPLIIQQGNRKAVINGDRVALLRVGNKKRDTGVWPETAIPDGEARLFAALAWVARGFIELPGVGA